jgi:hypothetical protein
VASFVATLAGLKQGRRKVTRAFKIDESLDSSILEKAEKVGITPSSLVSQVLKTYIEWGQFAGPGTTQLTVEKEIFVALLGELPEERLVDIARSSSLVAAHEFLKFRYHKVNLVTVLDYIDKLSLYSNLGEMTVVRDEYDRGSYEINVRHSLGMKWSIFLSEYISGIFSSFLRMQTSAEVSPLGCSVRAKMPDESS